MKISGAKILINALMENGVDTVFGYPGNAVLPIYDELNKKKSKIKHILTAGEQGAVFAADGYARTSGKVGVVIATSGPGATNLITGIANAYLDSSAIVIITGNVETSSIGKDSFQEVDIMNMTMPITKHNYMVKDINDLYGAISDAFRIAKEKRCGPVLIDIPSDIQKALTTPRTQPVYEETICEVQDKDLQNAYNLISKSKKPLIYAGGGVISANAQDGLLMLSHLLSAPICTSLMGLTCVPHDYKYNLGMLGVNARKITEEIKSNADLIIALGVRFSNKAAGNYKTFANGAKVLHVDIDPCEINKNVPADLGICTDLSVFLNKLCEKLNTEKVKANTTWKKEVDALLSNKPAKKEREDLYPQYIINELQKFTDKDTIIATDVGQHQMWTARYYHFEKPKTLLTSGGLGAMGFGLGAAIGACMASGKKRTVLISGDGSFGMSLSELATAVTNKLPIVIIIMNNSSLGLVRQLQKEFYSGRICQTELSRKTNFATLSKAFGAKGVTVKDKAGLKNALQSAFLCKKPYVIDCRISQDEEISFSNFEM